MNHLPAVIAKAVGLRRPLLSLTNAMRLVNGHGDGMDGLLIDRYHRHVHVQILSGDWGNRLPEIQQVLTALMPVDYLIVKSRRGLDVQAQVLIGIDPATVVQEYGLKFAVHCQDGLNSGLFLDMRANRRLVAQACRGKKVLNGFAYTCSFGVHARATGAREVINVDINRKILAQGSGNYVLNGLPSGTGEFTRADTTAFLTRAVKKNNTFDVIVLDPPSFARHEGKVFQVRRDLPKLLALGIATLAPGGYLLVTANYSGLTHADLERMMAKGLNGRRVQQLERVGQDSDFPGSNTFKESHLVGLWAKFL